MWAPGVGGAGPGCRAPRGRGRRVPGAPPPRRCGRPLDPSAPGAAAFSRSVFPPLAQHRPLPFPPLVRRHLAPYTELPAPPRSPARTLGDLGCRRCHSGARVVGGTVPSAAPDGFPHLPWKGRGWSSWGQGDFWGKGLDFSHPSPVTAHQSPAPQNGVWPRSPSRRRHCLPVRSVRTYWGVRGGEGGHGRRLRH